MEFDFGLGLWTWTWIVTIFWMVDAWKNPKPENLEDCQDENGQTRFSKVLTFYDSNILVIPFFRVVLKYYY